MIIKLKKSNRKEKKWMVIIDGRKVHFGASGWSDYTIHGDKKRMERYVARHRKRENWTKSGINTPGFWSRWLLWSKPSMNEAIQLIENNFNVNIIKQE